MLTEQKLYFLKGGDVTKPFTQVRMLTPSMQVVCSSNLAKPGDVNITEEQFDQYTQDVDTAIEAEVVSLAQDRIGKINSAATKLLALGLTQDEIDVMFI